MKEESRERRPQALEKNIELYPVFSTSRKPLLDKHILAEEITDSDGSRMHRTWSAAMPVGEKMPSAFDRDVYFAVMEIVCRRGGIPEGGTLDFSFYEVAKTMGLSTSNSTIKKNIRASLERLASLTIRSEGTFSIGEEHREIRETLGIWDVRFDESTNSRGERRTRHSLYFREFFRRSYEAKPIAVDAALYWSLQRPISKALYCLVEAMRRENSELTVDLFELSRRMAIGPYSQPYKIRERLKPAHAELLCAGYLGEASYPDSHRVSYRLSGDYLKGISMPAESEEHREFSAKELHALELLLSYQIHAGVARRLVFSHGAEACQRAVCGLDHEREMGRTIKSPAGWLRNAIEKGYDFSAIKEVGDSTQKTREAEEKRRWEGYEFFFDKTTTSHESSLDSSPQADREHQDTSGQEPDPEAQKVWEGVLEKVSQTINAPSLRVWFESVVPTGLGEDTLTLCVPNSFAKEYIETRFRGVLEEALAGALGREEARLELTIAGAPEGAGRAVAETIAGKEEEAIGELVGAGVDHEKARKMVATHGAALCHDKTSRIPEEVEDRAGWLLQAIAGRRGDREKGE